MKRIGAFIAAILLLVGAALYVQLQEDCGDCGNPAGAPDRPSSPAKSKPAAEPTDKPAVASGNFDYYVLALSWSPSYCATEATERDRLQCGGGTRFGFVVHGLWPQAETGYPEKCQTDAPRVPDSLIDEMLDIMPARGLIGYEWRTHGACTGLDQEDYFATLRSAFEAVAIPAALTEPATEQKLSPAEIERDFLVAAPALKAEDIVVTCDKGALDEVRVCLTKDLAFRACGEAVSRSQCRQSAVRVLPIAAR